MAKKAKNSKKKAPSNAKKGVGKKTHTIKLTTDLNALAKPKEYLEFITFMAIPDVLREEQMGLKTQQDFATKFGIDAGTLSDWKKRVGFWDDVIAVRKDFFKARTANVILALETKSLDPEKVQGQDVRVLLTYTGEYSDRNETEHRIHPELAAALERIGKVLA